LGVSDESRLRILPDFPKHPKEPNVQSEALRNLIAACIKSIQFCKYVGCMKCQLIVFQRCIPKFQEMLLFPSPRARWNWLFTFLVLFSIKITFQSIFILVAPSKRYWYLWHVFLLTLSSQIHSVILIVGNMEEQMVCLSLRIEGMQRSIFGLLYCNYY
jgi:hypothetical protein